MITSAIGKIFLNAYNEEYGTSYDARTFFLDVFYPLFFDSEKKMMKAGNTSLGNPSYNSKSNTERLNILLKNVDNNKIDSSVCVDFPSYDATTRNSGQVSSLQIPLTQEDVFYSWIGNGFRIGIQSDLKGKDELFILFFNKKIMLDIFRGWKQYRLRLDNIQDLQGNQIHVWNAHWLYNMYISKDFDINHPPQKIGELINNSKGLLFKSLGWLDLVYSIAKQMEFPNILGYVYGVDKNNNFISIGFRTFYLNQIIYPYDLYDKYFGISNGRVVRSMWDTSMGFKTACTAGAIGIKAMEPKGLMPYIKNDIKTKTLCFLPYHKR